MNDIIITLDNDLKLYIDVETHPLATKWFGHFEHLLKENYGLEKNFCFLGFPEYTRNGDYLCADITQCVAQINRYFNGEYHIDRTFSQADSFNNETLEINQEPMNWLHRHFEELQGVVVPKDGGANLSPFYYRADDTTKLAIRKLNLLCHEFESWLLAHRRLVAGESEWIRPSQLMCWLHAPRFELEDADFDAFGIDRLIKEPGGVYLGTNKAIGKTHYEVYCDEHGRDVNHLVTITMRSQTLAAGDVDIEWGQNLGTYDFKKKETQDFVDWLVRNVLDPNNKLLGIGHPKVAQVDLLKSFGTTDHSEIYNILKNSLNVVSVETKNCRADYPYRWSDDNYDELQIKDLYHSGRR